MERFLWGDPTKRAGSPTKLKITKGDNFAELLVASGSCPQSFNFGLCLCKPAD